MPSSSSPVHAADSPPPARFDLWPLPELKLVPPGADPTEHSPPSTEESAYERGLADGRRAGAQEQADGLRRATEALRAITEALNAARADFAVARSENLKALAVAIAQRIIGREINADPSAVQELAERALDEVDLEGPVRVRLNPDDLAALQDTNSLPAKHSTNSPVEWTPDTEISRGGCVVEHPRRIIDGQVETALLALYQKLRNA